MSGKLWDTHSELFGMLADFTDKRLKGASPADTPARARIEGGIVRPSARATFRLIISSNRVGCRADEVIE